MTRRWILSRGHFVSVPRVETIELRDGDGKLIASAPVLPGTIEMRFPNIVGQPIALVVHVLESGDEKYYAQHPPLIPNGGDVVVQMS